MNRASYPPAASVAKTIAEHFRQHAAERAPDAATIERLINAAFWTSLRREEGRAPTISLAWLPREEAGTALFVERPLPLDPATLTRLGPSGMNHIQPRDAAWKKMREAAIEPISDGLHSKPL